MAKTNYVPVSWKIYRRDNGEADNLDPYLTKVLQSLGIPTRGSQYLSEVCCALIRDKITNLGTGDAFGVGSCLMPKKVADSLVAVYGVGLHRLDVKIDTETDFELFYNDRAMIDQVPEKINEQELAGINARIALEKSLGIVPPVANVQRRKNALNPNHRQPGVTKNKLRFWADAKIEHKVTIHPSVAKV